MWRSWWNRIPTPIWARGSTNTQIFWKRLKTRPNAKNLQEMLFYIIHQGGHKGRENLQFMTPATFEDPDGRKYIHQVINEHKKNHKQTDCQPSNQARIHVNPSMLWLSVQNVFITKFHNKFKCTITVQRVCDNSKKCHYFLDSSICPVKINQLYMLKLTPSSWFSLAMP